MTVFAPNLVAPETPRRHPNGGWYCVEMAGPRAGITFISDDGVSRQVAPAGCPNGLCIDSEGNAYVADTIPPSLLKVTPTGSVETLMNEGDFGPFLLPNDLCFSSSGLLYMTDSGMKMSDWVVEGAPRPDWKSASYDGKLWEIDISSRTARAIDRGLRFANGIAFGPDGSLYINEMISGNIYRYDVTNGQVSGKRKTFANVLSPQWQGGFRGPDGMCFSSDGRLWCTVYGEGVVAVITPDGEVSERRKTQGNAPTNVAFGPDGENRLYISEHELGHIETMETDARAFTLSEGKVG